MKISGAEILVKTLIEQGVDTIFGYPGGNCINIYDELYKYQDKLTHILTAHEQGAAHAADGYARVTGKVGTVIATSGPGSTNLVTGIATAFLDSIPVVAITGNVPSELIGSDSFQEVDTTGITMPITKHNFFVNRVEKLADVVREAFKLAKSGRPGPVLVDIPKDVQLAVCEYEEKAVVEPYEKYAGEDEELEIAARCIMESERPYIYCGGGIILGDASDEVIELANKADAYIGTSLMGISAIPFDNERYLGMQGMHGHYASTFALHEADCIVAVGARFSDRATGKKSTYAPNARIIHIDIDHAEIDKNISVDYGITGDVKKSLRKIIDLISQKNNTHWHKRISELRKKEEETSPVIPGFNPRNILEKLNSYINEDTFVVTDVGQNQMWAAQYCKFTKPRQFITSGGLGTMGFGLGASIGASMGSGKKAVLVTGDGGFAMCLNELVTAVTWNIPVVIILLNNSALGMVKQMQELFFEKRFSTTILNRKTDYVKLAEAFGASGFRVSDMEEYSDALKKAFDTNGPVIVECVIDREELVLPMLPGGKSLDDIILERSGN